MEPTGKPNAARLGAASGNTGNDSNREQNSLGRASGQTAAVSADVSVSMTRPSGRVVEFARRATSRQVEAGGLRRWSIDAAVTMLQGTEVRR